MNVGTEHVAASLGAAFLLWSALTAKADIATLQIRLEAQESYFRDEARRSDRRADSKIARLELRIDRAAGAGPAIAPLTAQPIAPLTAQPVTPRSYIGIGITFLALTGEILFVKPNTPASAELRRGDRILEIDDEPVSDEFDIANRLRGIEGSSVTITIDRDGDRYRHRHVTMIRRVIR